MVVVIVMLAIYKVLKMTLMKTKNREHQIGSTNKVKEAVKSVLRIITEHNSRLSWNFNLIKLFISQTKDK